MIARACIRPALRISPVAARPWLSRPERACFRSGQPTPTGSRHMASTAADLEVLEAMMSKEPPPDSFLSVPLQPQGTHALWVDGVDFGLPQVSTATSLNAGNTLGAGLWECTPGSWKITRTTSETFLVLKGEAVLQDADGSHRATLAPGMWHTTPGMWHTTPSLLDRAVGGHKDHSQALCTVTLTAFTLVIMKLEPQSFLNKE